jgi:hypothetical protein
MSQWQAILNTALLGTDKRLPTADELSSDLQEAAGLVLEGKATDKEEQFLQLAALVFNYRQCGVVPLRLEGVGIEPADEEDKAYCSPYSMQVLKDILDTGNIPLLTMWLEACVGKGQIVQPDVLPVLLSLGMQHKKLQPLLGACCGKRGAWLSKFNPEWNFTISTSPEEVWQTGTLEQRKAVLQELRAADPIMAREWLQGTWAQEDANTKTELLGMLSDKIGEADIVFLESLSTEKSKKVKELALQLLKQIPTSTIVQQYQAVLRQAVVLKQERSMMGMKSKSSLEIQLPDGIDESIYKSGIDKLSSHKSLSDEEYIVYQLAQVTPPSFWEQQFNIDPESIIELLQKSGVGKRLLPALAHAVVLGSDTGWALAFMNRSDVFYGDMLPLLPVDKQEHYSIRYFEKHADTIIQNAVQRSDEWSLAFAQLVLPYTARSPYQYNRQFYEQHIEQIPVLIAGELDKYKPKEESQQSLWNNISAYLKKLLGLKTQIFQSFNAIN